MSAPGTPVTSFEGFAPRVASILARAHDIAWINFSVNIITGGVNITQLIQNVLQVNPDRRAMLFFNPNITIPQTLFDFSYGPGATNGIIRVVGGEVFEENG